MKKQNNGRRGNFKIYKVTTSEGLVINKIGLFMKVAKERIKAGDKLEEIQNEKK